MTWHTPPPSYAIPSLFCYKTTSLLPHTITRRTPFTSTSTSTFTLSDSSDNMNEEHIITVCPEQVSTQTTPLRSSTSSNDVVISVDEISISMEDAANATYLEAAAMSSGETRQCRFCHGEDLLRPLEAPCGCSGTLRYAHRSCTTAWCNTKGSIVCEICELPYGPDYAVTEESSTNTRVVMESESSMSTPTTITQVQSPLQQPDQQRAASLARWANLMVPCRGLLYATLLVLFLLALIVNDVFSFTKTTKKEPKKAFNVMFVVIMMLLAPFSLLSCFYECRAMIQEHFAERNRRAAAAGQVRASRI